MSTSAAGPSSGGFPAATASTHKANGLHVHPHNVHVEEEEEIDYESLPVGAGWGVNMAAGAMVRRVGVFRHAVP